jgi:hypothetical protein
MLITLVVTLVVLALVYRLVSLLPLPDPFELIVKVLFILIAVLYILNAFGVLHTGNLV